MVAQEEAIAFCTELLRYPSYSGQEREAVDAVRRKMAALGYEDIFIDELGSVAGCKRGGRPGAAILFDCHVDTVDVTSPERWRHPPFGGVIDGGRLYGRGSSDTKSGLAAAVVAIGHLDSSDLAGDVWVGATIGEEVMEGVGLPPMLDRIRPHAVVVSEPTALRVGFAQKGRCSVILRVRGVAAHTSRPELGLNAVYRALPVIERLRALPPIVDPVLGSTVIELIDIGSLPQPPNSIVPDECHVRFDCRLVLGETKQSFLGRVTDTVGDADVEIIYSPRSMDCYTGVHLEIDDFYPAWSMPTDHPLVAAALDAAADAGRPRELWAVQACTNGSLSAGVRGIPTIVFGPGGPEQAHVVDEFVELASLRTSVDAYAALARRLLAGESSLAAWRLL